MKTTNILSTKNRQNLKRTTNRKNRNQNRDLRHSVKNGNIEEMEFISYKKLSTVLDWD